MMGRPPRGDGPASRHQAALEAAGANRRNGKTCTARKAQARVTTAYIGLSMVGRLEHSTTDTGSVASWTMNCWQWLEDKAHGLDFIHPRILRGHGSRLHHMRHMGSRHKERYQAIARGHRRVRRGHWVWTCTLLPAVGLPAIGWAWRWPSAGQAIGAGGADWGGGISPGLSPVLTVPEPSTLALLLLAVVLTI